MKSEKPKEEIENPSFLKNPHEKSIDNLVNESFTLLPVITFTKSTNGNIDRIRSNIIPESSSFKVPVSYNEK